MASATVDCTAGNATDHLVQKAMQAFGAIWWVGYGGKKNSKLPQVMVLPVDISDQSKGHGHGAPGIDRSEEHTGSISAFRYRDSATKLIEKH